MGKRRHADGQAVFPENPGSIPPAKNRISVQIHWLGPGVFGSGVNFIGIPTVDSDIR
jgi:hypothetical protein